MARVVLRNRRLLLQGRRVFLDTEGVACCCGAIPCFYRAQPCPNQEDLGEPPCFPCEEITTTIVFEWPAGSGQCWIVSPTDPIEVCQGQIIHLIDVLLYPDCETCTEPRPPMCWKVASWCSECHETQDPPDEGDPVPVVPCDLVGLEELVFPFGGRCWHVGPGSAEIDEIVPPYVRFEPSVFFDECEDCCPSCASMAPCFQCPPVVCIVNLSVPAPEPPCDMIGFAVCESIQVDGLPLPRNVGSCSYGFQGGGSNFVVTNEASICGCCVAVAVSLRCDGPLNRWVLQIHTIEHYPCFPNGDCLQALCEGLGILLLGPPPESCGIGSYSAVVPVSGPPGLCYEGLTVSAQVVAGNCTPDDCTP